MPNPEPLINTAELARLLDVSPRTIQRYRKEGVLVPDVVLKGGHARWSVDNVRQQLREWDERRQR